MLSTEARISHAIERLFQVSVECSVATPAMYDAPLFPEEAASIAHAVAPRRREFAAGRACARAALSRLGAPHTTIPTGPRREPIWPAGFVGSISHCPGLCCAVAAHSRVASSIGIDVDVAEPLPANLTHLICTERDIVNIQSQTVPTAALKTKLLFCAKEAFYKCYYPIMGKFLDFGDVNIEVRPETESEGAFIASMSSEKSLGLAVVPPSQIYEFFGRWHIIEGIVLAGAWAIATAVTSDRDHPTPYSR